MKFGILGLLVAAGLVVGPAAQAATAYVAGGSGQFGTLDLGTGVFTSLGSTHIGPTTTILNRGLSVANGTLYGEIVSGGDNLYSVNPADGALTFIGTTAIDFADFGSTPSGGLYGADISGNLYSISTATGAATLIGNFGFGSGGFSSLSVNSATLYFTRGNGSLYTVNTGTGVASLVGPSCQCLASALSGGVLYGDTGTQIATINTATGAFTTGPTISPASIGIVGVVPVEAITPVPEPAAAWLFGAGLIGLLGGPVRARARDSSGRRRREPARHPQRQARDRC